VPQAFAANNQIQVIFSGAANGNFGAHPGPANFIAGASLPQGLTPTHMVLTVQRQCPSLP